MQVETSQYNRLVQVVGLLGVVLLPLWVWALFFSWDYDYSVALILVPALMVINLFLLQPASRGDPFLLRLLPVALVVKFAATALYLWMVFHVFTTGSDIVSYWGHGEEIARDLIQNGRWVTLHPFWSSNSIYMLTGLLFSVITPSLPTGVIVYSLISFWGQYLFYRAFVIGFPEGNRRLAAVLIFLLPSIVFWTSTIGKDAIMCFFLGLAGYGFARLCRRLDPASVILLLLGMAGAMVIRPHIALMLGTAFVAPYLLSRNRHGVAGVLGKIVGVPLLAAVCVFVAMQAKSFLGMEDLSQANQVLQRVSQGNLIGGSAFGASQSLVARILNTPFLLFRPWPWEVHNVTSVITSLEGLFLLGLFLRCRRSLYATVRTWRSNPFVFFTLAFSLQLSIILSAAITNFGLLSRERVMLLPFVMMLVCAPRIGARASQGVGAPGSEAWRPAPYPTRVPVYRGREIPLR